MADPRDAILALLLYAKHDLSLILGAFSNMMSLKVSWGNTSIVHIIHGTLFSKNTHIFTHACSLLR
jgi:hypothetical protein